MNLLQLYKHQLNLLINRNICNWNKKFNELLCNKFLFNITKHKNIENDPNKSSKALKRVFSIMKYYQMTVF